jgi:hypothetical protein
LLLDCNFEVGQRLGFPGLSLKATAKLAEGNGSKELAKTLESIYSELGWEFAAAAQKTTTVVGFPHAQLFI